MNLLGEQYQRLYADYYGHDQQTMEKRELTAHDTLAHIRSMVGATRFEKVIDVGAGEGSLLQLLDQSEIAQSLYGLEISESALRIIKARNLSHLVECTGFDGYQIHYPDKHFDLAISIHVLEHVEHERLLLKELRRVAKRLVIEIPIEGGLRAERSIAVSGPFGHINFYTPPTFLNLLRTSGFHVIKSRVLTSSLRLERFCGGPTKGAIKSALRRGALAVMPRLAPALMTYLMTAYCEAA